MRKELALFLLLGLAAKASNIEESLEDGIISTNLEDSVPEANIKEEENTTEPTGGFLSGSARPIETVEVIETLQNIVKTIQEPIGDSLDAIKSWVSGDSRPEKNIEENEATNDAINELEENNIDVNGDNDDKIMIHIEQPKLYFRADVTQDADVEEWEEEEEEEEKSTISPNQDEVEERAKAEGDDQRNTKEQEKDFNGEEKIRRPEEVDDGDDDDDDDDQDQQTFLRGNLATLPSDDGDEVEDRLNEDNNMGDLKELEDEVVVFETPADEAEVLKTYETQKRGDIDEKDRPIIIENTDTVDKRSFFAKVRDFIAGGRAENQIDRRRYYDGL